MKKELPSMSDKELDELFRQINENPDISYQSADWDRMKAQLDHISPNRRIKSHGHGYNGWLVGILVLMIFFGAGVGWNYWKGGQNEIGPLATEKTNSILNKKSISEQISTLNSNPTKSQEAEIRSLNPKIGGGLSTSKNSQMGIRLPMNIAEDGEGIHAKEDAGHLGKSMRKGMGPEENIPGFGANGKIPIAGKSIGSGSLLNVGQVNLGKPLRFSGKKKDLIQGSRLSLALLIAPDVTALTLNEIKGLGNSVGLNLEYYIKPNLSINTGILYAFKTYQGGEGYYPAYQPAPSGIEGNCWILDVPLNVRYYAFERPLSKWYISGGISTYLMLREKYGLEYSSYGNYYTKSLDLKNENQHYFGIVNLSVGYERLLSEKLSLQIEPYLKVPVNGIGEGQISLKSAGALIGLKYNW